jgi:hypothetical protein
MAMNQPGIELHIDELVVRGVPPRDRERFLAALERELARLLDGRGTVSGRTARSKRQSGDDDLAAQVAQDIYQGMSTTGGQPVQ